MGSTITYEYVNGGRLWIDGDFTYDEDGIIDEILCGDAHDGRELLIHDETDTIRKTMKLVQFDNPPLKLKVKTSVNYTKLDDTFNIPEHYLKLDLFDYLIEKLIERVGDNTDEDYLTTRIERILYELKVYKEAFKTDVVRTAIYMVDTFIDSGVIWGSGRGSSCCSYVLYLIGLHDVDSVMFDLDINEFLR